MITKDRKAEIVRTIGKIQDLMEEYADCREEISSFKTAVEAYNLATNATQSFQCPFSVYPLACDKATCQSCDIKIAAIAKIKGDEVCEFCGTDLSVEKEAFGNDRLFTEHNCKGGINATNKG